MKDVRHWWIQVSDTCNMTPEVGGAVFQEHAPTISLKGFRWVKAYSAEDIVKKIGMTPRRWAEINQELGEARTMLRRVLDSEVVKQAPFATYSEAISDAQDYFKKAELIRSGG